MEEYSLEEKILLISLPICTLGFIGNLIILWLLCCKLKIKLSLYFVCVAVADLLIICNIIGDFITFFTRVSFSLMFERVMYLLYLTSHHTTFNIFTAIAAERWCTHFFPVWYKRCRAKNFSAIMSLSLWGFSSLVSFANYYACSPTIQIHNHNVENCLTSIIIEIMTGLIFIPSMIFFSLGIWIRIQMRQEGTPLVRLDITIIAIVLLFLMLNVPLKLTIILKYWVSSIDGHMLGNICTLFDSISSSICPLIYLIVGCWKKQKRTETFLMFFERALSDKTAMIV